MNLGWSATFQMQWQGGPPPPMQAQGQATCSCKGNAIAVAGGNCSGNWWIMKMASSSSETQSKGLHHLRVKHLRSDGNILEWKSQHQCTGVGTISHIHRLRCLFVNSPMDHCAERSADLRSHHLSERAKTCQCCCTVG